MKITRHLEVVGGPEDGELIELVNDEKAIVSMFHRRHKQGMCIYQTTDMKKAVFKGYVHNERRNLE